MMKREAHRSKKKKGARPEPTDEGNVITTYKIESVFFEKACQEVGRGDPDLEKT